MKKNISKNKSSRLYAVCFTFTGVGLSCTTSNFNFLWIVIAVGALQVISPITKFCPVYTILNKLMPETDPIQNGK